MKVCPITINNEAVTVCKYDETLIQFPSIHDAKAKTVNVVMKNRLYYIAEDKAEQPVTQDKAETGDKENNK